MRAKLAALTVTLFLGAGVCMTQDQPQDQAKSAPVQPDYSAVNCAGFVSDERVPTDTYLISGEQSNFKIGFAFGDYVYINRGQDQGVQIGDHYMVVRQFNRRYDSVDVNWFKSQTKLLKAMGTTYIDAGQLRVVNVQPKVSIAQISFSCGYMLRGDIVRPFVDRPYPPFKEAATFDHFAPVSGKPVGMLVSAFDDAQEFAKNNAVYINLGTNQGAKVGDYVRFFRYQGPREEFAPTTKNYHYMIYGFGSTPIKYQWNDLPREVLGEGIVINISKNSSTVLVTFSSIPLFTGDYLELE